MMGARVEGSGGERELIILTVKLAKKPSLLDSPSPTLKLVTVH